MVFRSWVSVAEALQRRPGLLCDRSRALHLDSQQLTVREFGDDVDFQAVEVTVVVQLERLPSPGGLLSQLQRDALLGKGSEVLASPRSAGCGAGEAREMGGQASVVQGDLGTARDATARRPRPWRKEDQKPAQRCPRTCRFEQ